MPGLPCSLGIGSTRSMRHRSGADSRAEPICCNSIREAKLRKRFEHRCRTKEPSALTLRLTPKISVAVAVCQGAGGLAVVLNHREVLAAPTITFGVLSCFFAISHGPWRILHFNVTNHPTSSWIIPELREAFPFDSTSRFLIFDRDVNYGSEVPVAVWSPKMSPVRTSFESPWQNGVTERWIESCRQDLLDHVAALTERHLKQMLSE